MSGHSRLVPGDYLNDPEVRAGYEEARRAIELGAMIRQLRLDAGRLPGGTGAARRDDPARAVPAGTRRGHPHDHRPGPDRERPARHLDRFHNPRRVRRPRKAPVQQRIGPSSGSQHAPRLLNRGPSAGMLDPCLLGCHGTFWHQAVQDGARPAEIADNLISGGIACHGKIGKTADS